MCLPISPHHILNYTWFLFVNHNILWVWQWISLWLLFASPWQESLSDLHNKMLLTGGLINRKVFLHSFVSPTCRCRRGWFLMRFGWEGSAEQGLQLRSSVGTPRLSRTTEPILCIVSPPGVYKALRLLCPSSTFLANPSWGSAWITMGHLWHPQSNLQVTESQKYLAPLPVWETCPMTDFPFQPWPLSAHTFYSVEPDTLLWRDTLVPRDNDLLRVTLPVGREEI